MAANPNSYEGRVPKAQGTGPKNLPKTSPASTPTPRVSPSRAGAPRMSPARASAGYGPPPGGAGGGVAKATTPMAKAPGKVINRPKTGRPGRGMGKPKADGSSRI